MPAYTPYLTDTDRAIDRDANELPTQRNGYSGAGYIAQGYANMDVLPEQMRLQELLESRQRLSMNSRRGRQMQAEEDTKLANQNEFDGYSGFVRGLKGLPEEERVRRMRDRLVDNPNEAINPLVKESSTAILAGDQAVLDAKKNTLEAKRTDYEIRAAEYDEDNFDERVKLKDLEFSNARESARLTQKQIEVNNYQFDQQDVSKVGENIFSMNAFGEDRDTRDKLIKTIALLPKETEEDRNNLRALSEITGGIAIGNQVKQLKSYADIQHRDLLRGTLKSTGIDISRLPKDRAERNAFIAKVGNAILAKGGDIQSFNSYVEKVKGYNDTEEALGQLTADFTESIAKLEQLAKSDDFGAKKELVGEIALIRAKASGQANHFKREYDNFEKEEKIREKNSEIAARDASILLRMRSANTAERRAANSEYATAFRNNMAASKDQMSRLKWAQKLVDERGQDSLGLDSDATVKDVLDYANEEAPPVEPGVSTRDF